MKKKLKQILFAILCHDYEVVCEVVKEHNGLKIYNKQNQVMCRCRRCGKTKWMWELRLEIGDYVQLGGISYKVVGANNCGDNVLHRLLNLSTNYSELFSLWELTNAFLISKYPIEQYSTFDKVMVRCGGGHVWKVTLFELLIVSGEEVMFSTMSGEFPQCVPYNKDTEELLGTKDEAPEFYKTWEGGND